MRIEIEYPDPTKCSVKTDGESECKNPVFTFIFVNSPTCEEHYNKLNASWNKAMADFAKRMKPIRKKNFTMKDLFGSR